MPWTSSADFQAGPDGKVSLAQKPVSGYPTADPMALFGLMKPSRGDDVFFAGGRTLDVTLRASLDGKVVAQAIAHRRSPDDLGVRHRDLRPATDGLYGTLYLPADTSTPRPALVVFGGSEGGLSRGGDRGRRSAGGARLPGAGVSRTSTMPGLPATLTGRPAGATSPGRPADSARRLPPGVRLSPGSRRSVRRAQVESVLLVELDVRTSCHDIVGRAVTDLAGRADTGSARRLCGAWTAVRSSPRCTRYRSSESTAPVPTNCGGQDGEWPSRSLIDAISFRLKQHHFRYPVTVCSTRTAATTAGSSPRPTSGRGPRLSRAAGAFPGLELDGDLAGAADSHAKLLALLGSL